MVHRGQFTTNSSLFESFDKSRVMKIICVEEITQYIKELKNNIHKKFYFLKPETSIPIKNQPFIPDFQTKSIMKLKLLSKLIKPQTY